MRYGLLMIGYWLLCVGCGAKGPAKTEQAIETDDAVESSMDMDVEYTKEDSALVVKLLTEAQTQRGKENRMMYFGKKFWDEKYHYEGMDRITSDIVYVATAVDPATWKEEGKK